MSCKQKNREGEDKGRLGDRRPQHKMTTPAAFRCGDNKIRAESIDQRERDMKQLVLILEAKATQ